MCILIYDKNLIEQESIYSILKRKYPNEEILRTDSTLDLTDLCARYIPKMIVIGLTTNSMDNNQTFGAEYEISTIRSIYLTGLKSSILFIADDSTFAMKAFQVDASAYLLRPFKADSFVHQLNCLRYPLQYQRKKINIQCFGNFGIFYNNRAIKFKYTKTQEILAYLVDRHGVMCTVNEIICHLWPDDKDHDSYFKTLRKDLYDTLKSYDCDYLILKQRGRMGFNLTDDCSCDFYEWERGMCEPNLFKGEYMNQYSWAEYTTGILSQTLNSICDE